MYTQKQEQKIKTIDLNDFLDGFHNYRTLTNDRDTINSHPFTLKLRSHIKQRAQTCFSIQTFNPQTRSSNRTNIQNRYMKEQPLKEEDEQNLQSINIDQFMHAICHKNSPTHNENAHQFIRSLNGTWFQGTNEQFKCAKIFNTLGIKKNRSLVRPRSERYNPEYHQRDRVNFTKQFRPNGLFPSRKVTIPNRMKLVKSPSFTHQHPKSPSRNNEGSLKIQIVNSIKNELNARVNSRLSSSRGTKNIAEIAAGNFNNQKIVNKMNKEGVVKGKKMVIYD